MTNSAFLEAYKAKCLEKGLPPLYTNAEEFDKAMNEPPKPYSSDDFTPKKSPYEKLGEQDVGDNWGVDVLEIDVGDMEDFEQVAIDAKKRKEDKNVKKVEWKRCEHCGEMKEEIFFRRYRNGAYGKVCNACISSKISAGHKKNAKSTEEPTPKGERLKALATPLSEMKIAVPKSTLPKLPNSNYSDASIAFGMALHVKEETPLLKESKPLLAMSEEAFGAAILFAYEKGKEDAEALDVEEITEIGAESLAMRIILNLKSGEQ